MRLDRYLFEMGWAQSRQKAQELIASRSVFINHELMSKSSFEVPPHSYVFIAKQEQWVARSGGKLYEFLLSSGVSVKDKQVLDIGSSTGGFSEVLLRFGARSITCIDVGTDQLHSKLRADPRIALIENQDIRSFDHPPFEFVVCDVSFVSLSLLIAKIHALTQEEALLLFKPQFEVGREAKRNKKGVVLSKSSIQEALANFLRLCREVGFEVKSSQPSLIKGKNGNEEYFIHLLKI